MDLQTSEFLEIQIGQFWFAKIGIVILALGITFLITFPFKHLPAAVPSFMGSIIVRDILTLANYLLNSLTFLSRYLSGGGLVLLYFVAIGLHYLGLKPVIVNKALVC
ncbi:MAG TPA: hypothetical protein ENL09_04615 [Bacteroidetes bacterium]|nr:hypothetical protein [Bacteroidota bacterium]